MGSCVIQFEICHNACSGEINIHSWRCESEIQEGDQTGRYLKVISMEMRMDKLTPKAVGSGIIHLSESLHSHWGGKINKHQSLESLGDCSLELLSGERIGTEHPLSQSHLSEDSDPQA